MQNKQEQELLAAFHLMTVAERSFLLQTAQALTEDRLIERPRLRLVSTGSSVLSGSSLRSGYGS